MIAPMSSNYPGDGMSETAIQRLAERYREEGYDVILHPRREEMPSFAADFQVELIARRASEGVIVEVKTNRIDLASDDQLTRLAEITNAQHGWRLDVVVLEQETAVERAAEGAAEPSDAQLTEILNAAEDLANKGYAPAACVLAWGGLEAAMRRTRDDAELYGRTTANELMRALYGNGFLSREQFEWLRESYKIRSQVVHGLVPPMVDPELVRHVTATARQLLHGGDVAVASG